MTKKLTATVTLSSHPEFRFFAEIRYQGRQLAGRFNTRTEVADWLAKASTSATHWGFVLDVVDETPSKELGYL